MKSNNKKFYNFSKRILDVNLLLFCIVLFVIPIISISLLIRVKCGGNILHWSERVGKNNIIFLMPKFRTMYLNTPSVATHLLENPEQKITPIGKVLRKYSLDELPQLWSVFKGDMSFVGPRPALYNQYDLIKLRTNASIHKIVPGITGYAQINGRDDLTITNKVKLDVKYLNNRNILLDLKIILSTLQKTLTHVDIHH